MVTGHDVSCEGLTHGITLGTLFDKKNSYVIYRPGCLLSSMSSSINQVVLQKTISKQKELLSSIFRLSSVVQVIFHHPESSKNGTYHIKSILLV